MVKGFARDQSTLRFLDKALMAGSLSFKEAEVYGDADRLPMVNILWQQGQALANPEAVSYTHLTLPTNREV